MNIRADQLKGAIVQNLKDYSYNVQWDVSEASRKWIREGTKWLRKNHAVHDTGHYNKGWKMKKTPKGYMIYNSNRPELTHLLEYGHAKSDGTDWVEGIPHIKPVESQLIGNFESEVREIIRKNGAK